MLDEAITSLQSIPDELDRSIAEVESSRTRVGQQVWLWRLAIVAGGAALVVMLVLIAQLRERQRIIANGGLQVSRSTGGRGRGCDRPAMPAACAPSTAHRRAPP